MKKLYLVRHGESYFNQIRKTQGWCDSPLTENGRRQAKKVRQYLIEHGININHGLSSSLGRARESMEIISNNYIDSLEYSKDLRELCFGRFEGESIDILPPLPFADYFLAYGGESEDQALNRFTNKIQACLDQEDIDQLLVVSHGTIIRNFCLHWRDSRIDFDILNPNGSILIFTYSNHSFYLEEYVKNL